MKIKDKKLIWGKDKFENDQFNLITTDKEELARINFTNFSNSEASTKSFLGDWKLDKTGFPNQTTIHFSNKEKKIAKAIISAEGEIEFADGKKIQYLQLTGECKFKVNGIGSADYIILKPVLDGLNSRFEIEIFFDSMTDEELLIMSVTGFYVMFHSGVKTSVLEQVLLLLGLVLS
jgi:hypothetical protein